MSSSLQTGAPIQDAVVDQDGKATKSWTFFFNDIVDGDTGKDWTPVATSLGGTYNLSGKYYKNSGFIDFWILIDPITSSTSNLATTFIDLPFDATIATAANVVYNNVVQQAIVDPITNRLFTPTWAAIAAPITISGRIFTK